MKSERRHELRENDLLHGIGVARKYIAGKGKPLGLAVLIAGAVIVVGGMAMRTRAVAQEDQWRRLSQLTFDNLETGRQSLDVLISLTDSSSDDGFVVAGLMDQGLQALRLSQKSQIPPDRELNEKAQNAFSQLLKRFPRNAVAVGVAHSGLATVEENLFVLTGDSDHKSRAATHLTAIIENDMLNGMPFQRLAIDRRNALDSTFSDVRFVMSDGDSDLGSISSQQPFSIEAFKTLPLELQEKIGSPEELNKVLQRSGEPVFLDPTAPGTEKTDDKAPADSDTP